MPRAKKCKACGGEYIPMNSLQKACSVPCAIKLVEIQKEKKIRKEMALKKVELRSRRDWLTLAQRHFNAYIRERDKTKPCISCGRHHAGQYHAGHYLSTGARPELRFEEDNCHRQCAPCNDHLSGNIVLYRKALVAKIGMDRVEWLEGPHAPKKWSIDELKEICKTYSGKQRALKKAESDRRLHWVEII